MKSNDAEYLVEIIDGKRFYKGKYLAPAQMIWQCTTEDCTVSPKIQRRGQYKDKKLCNACSNRLKSKNPEILKRRGKAISEAIKGLGDKWSKVAKINNSDPRTKKKISDSVKEYIKENFEEAIEIRRDTATQNNKISGFGTSDFGKKIWNNLSDKERMERTNRAWEGSVTQGKEDHIKLMKERCPNFKLIKYGTIDDITGYNVYECPESHQFEMYTSNFIKRLSCPICSPKSQPQIDWSNWLKNYLPDTKTNKRVLFLDETMNGNRALEIDIYSESAKFGIEIHGLYYHQERNEGKQIGVERGFHKKKAELAEKHNIKLLQFFDDELIDKAEIVRSIILAKLGKSERLFARDCDIVELERKETRAFLENNHLQGSCRSSFLNLGLKYQGKLVSVISFRRNKDRKDQAEIARFCNILNTSVIGGFSRLLKSAEQFLISKVFNSILTYSDRRYSNGMLYKNNGFLFIKNTDPDFFWVKRGKRFARQISWGISGKDMRENGYYKVFGAGNSRWEKEIKKPDF